jgi:hypothetical protein
VLFHGATVAYYSPKQSIEAVAMFLFGFMTLFVVTQAYGLGLSKRALKLISGGYILLLIVYYWGSWLDMVVVLRIPFVEYGLILVFSLLFMGVLALKRRDKELEI